MIPGGFKKDSRVWLHKNKSFRKVSNCDCDGQKIGHDDPYQCVPRDNVPELPIKDASGRIYKKDSRTWLHKSSKAKMKCRRTGDLLEERGNRLNWRQEVRGLSAGEIPEGVMRTRSSTELIRAQAGVNKIKKKKTMMLMSMMMAPSLTSGGGAQVKSIPESRLQPGSENAKQASYHSIGGARKGCTTVSAFASDLCIARKDSSPSRISLHGDPTDSDNSNNEMNDEEDAEDEFEYAMDTSGFPSRTRNEGVSLACDKAKGGRGCLRSTTWNHSTVEITEDGLRELEKMMKQTQRRSTRLAKSFHDRPGQTPRRDVSPQSCDSQVSLEANLNLSDETMCPGQADLNLSQNSAEQLTQATEYLYVCSPNQRMTRQNKHTGT